MQCVRCCVFSLATWLPLAVSVPGAAAAPVLAGKGAAVHQALVCVSSRWARLGSAGGCVALPPQLPASFSPALSPICLPGSPGPRQEQQILFCFPVCPAQGGGRKVSVLLWLSVPAGCCLSVLACSAPPRPCLLPSHWIRSCLYPLFSWVKYFEWILLLWYLH